MNNSFEFVIWCVQCSRECESVYTRLPRWTLVAEQWTRSEQLVAPDINFVERKWTAVYLTAFFHYFGRIACPVDVNIGGNQNAGEKVISNQTRQPFHRRWIINLEFENWKVVFAANAESCTKATDHWPHELFICPSGQRIALNISARHP